MQQSVNEIEFMTNRVMRTGNPMMLQHDEQRQWIADARADFLQEDCDDCMTIGPFDQNSIECGLCKIAVLLEWPKIQPSKYPENMG